jgi:hypothetical protein
MTKIMNAYASHIRSVLTELRPVLKDGRIRVRSGCVVKGTLPIHGIIDSDMMHLLKVRIELGKNCHKVIRVT